jgi:protein phosphatase 4 regulatory subunit 3
VFYNQQMTQGKLFEPILNLVVETMPRDNLLNSACLEFFDFIKREHIKIIISHLVENYRDKMKAITYVDTFQNFILRFDQTQGFAPSMETSFLDTEEDTPKRETRGSRWENGIKDLDSAEEEYFNTSDDEDDIGKATSRPSMNGASPISKPLVDYPSDEENENMETDVGAVESKNPQPSPSKHRYHRVPISAAPSDEENETMETDMGAVESKTPRPSPSKRYRAPTSSAPSPPERLSEKRRREEDEEDEIGKLSQSKRRNSSSSVESNTNNMLRKKKSFTAHGGGSSGSKPNKIAISLSPAIKSGGEANGGGENNS